jgi:flagellar biosynthetic protein FlhB
MAGSDKTEKATPKRREEARKKGQIARSADLNGSVVLFVGVIALGAAGPGIAQRMGDVMRTALQMGARPEEVRAGNVGTILMDAMLHAALAVAPVVGACALAAVLVAAAQVGLKPKPGAMKPDPKRLNPVSGFKNIYGPNALLEGGKSIVKIAVVAGVVLSALMPHLTELGSLVGMSPNELASRLAADVKAIALRAAGAFLLIGLLDYAYQRFRHEKSLRMGKEEVKEEAKGQSAPAEVRAALRRRQMQAARARMMEAIPEADVIITNPTHYSVALKYDGAAPAPRVIAKGKDLIALRIREVAAEHGVPIIPEPPLARSLHASVEVGDEIPEELYAAVAQILAYVYRVARTRPTLSLVA